MHQVQSDPNLVKPVTIMMIMMMMTTTTMMRMMMTIVAIFKRFLSTCFAQTRLPLELRTRNYFGFAGEFGPNPMGQVPDPKTIKNIKLMMIIMIVIRMIITMMITIRRNRSRTRTTIIRRV